MKFIIISLFITLVSANSFAQSDVESFKTSEEFENKIKAYNIKQGVGLTILGTGVVLLPVGITKIAQADWEEHSTPTSVGVYTHDKSGAGGLVMTIIGSSMTVFGTIYSIKAISKKKYYKSWYANSYFKYQYKNNNHYINYCFSF